MAFVDSLVAEILRYLEEANLRQKTIVILTADHGEAYMSTVTSVTTHNSTKRVSGSLSWYDGPIGPLGGALRWWSFSIWHRRFSSHGTRGSSCPPGMEGRSFVPLFNGETLEPRLAFSRTVWIKPRYSVRDPATSSFGTAEPDRAELYDLDVDPEEKVNLVDDKALVDGYFGNNSCGGFESNSGFESRCSRHPIPL